MRSLPSHSVLALLLHLVVACGGSSSGNDTSSGQGGSTTSGSTASGSSATHGSAGGGGADASTTSGPSGSGGSATSSTGSGGPVITPGDPGAHDVLFAIDSTQQAHPISPFVYGSNQGDLTAEAKGVTMTRVGGNRLTAYNWETNASNAGNDYQYENDAYISTSSVAGDPMKKAVSAAYASNASIIMTVPMAGYVSADESGPCPSNPSAAQIAQHFFPIVPKKGNAAAYPPDLTDKKVYADEFVSWLEGQFPEAQTDPSRRIFYMLDNEPDLWSSTHSEIHPTPVTYAELSQKSIDLATAIKGVAPQALVFGPASYGWQGYVTLQNASDASGRDFLEYYLDQMKAAEGTAGKRLLDSLDVHWYPEATGDGARIVDDGTGAGEVEARLQAPRSLWDSTYTETSWITQYSTNGPIRLVPRLLEKIAAHYPNTKLSISEYNYGAGGDISGGLAEADALGVFGREGVFAASVWLTSSKNDYLFAGIAMFRNFDGKGGAFGDTSISLANDSIDKTSAYASVSSSDGTNVVVVAVNKETTTVNAGITLTHTAHLGKADVYQLTASGSKPVAAAGLTETATNAFVYAMPARSVTTLVFHP